MVKLRGNLTDKMEANPGKVHFRRWKAMSIGSRISLVVLILIVMIAVFANILAPHNPLEIFTARQAPDAQFLFGTDDKGRDVLSRMMYGARYSLIIGLGATAFALVCGSIIGAVAAMARKWVSEVIMRILDVIMSFPGIALAATFVLVFGNSVPSLIFAIGFLYIPQIARIVRANVVSEYNQDYVRAVVVSGARAPWILVKHVIRNCIAPVMVFTIVLVADAIVFEVAVVHLGRHSRAHAHVGQHPVRRPRRRACRSLVAGAVPGSGHHDHRAVPEHPVRGHHRCHGRRAQGPGQGR